MRSYAIGREATRRSVSALLTMIECFVAVRAQESPERYVRKEIESCDDGGRRLLLKAEPVIVFMHFVVQAPWFQPFNAFFLESAHRLHIYVDVLRQDHVLHVDGASTGFAIS